MCMMCDGYTFEEVLAYEAAQVDTDGFLVQAVGSPRGPDAWNWAYTVGLLDRADHPELIVAGTDLALAWSLLHALGDAVLAGDRFDVGDSIRLGGEVAHVGDVAPVQYTLETFTTWHNLRSYGALRAPALRAVQIIPSESGDAPGLLLSDPATRVGGAPAGARPNRAARRARTRRGRARP